MAPCNDKNKGMFKRAERTLRGTGRESGPGQCLLWCSKERRQQPCHCHPDPMGLKRAGIVWMFHSEKQLAYGSPAISNSQHAGTPRTRRGRRTAPVTPPGLAAARARRRPPAGRRARRRARVVRGVRKVDRRLGAHLCAGRGKGGEAPSHAGAAVPPPPPRAALTRARGGKSRSRTTGVRSTSAVPSRSSSVLLQRMRPSEGREQQRPPWHVPRAASAATVSGHGPLLPTAAAAAAATSCGVRARACVRVGGGDSPRPFGAHSCAAGPGCPPPCAPALPVGRRSARRRGPAADRARGRPFRRTGAQGLVG